jgi:hypothetical protein
MLATTISSLQLSIAALRIGVGAGIAAYSVTPGHNRSNNGVASLAYSRSKNGVVSLAYAPGIHV